VGVVGAGKFTWPSGGGRFTQAKKVGSGLCLTFILFTNIEIVSLDTFFPLLEYHWILFSIQVSPDTFFSIGVSLGTLFVVNNNDVHPF
jgi:hypothetical protein